MSIITHKIGFNSKGKYKTRENGKVTSAYHIWHHMIDRCYNPLTQAKHPSYKGCSVDKRWHDFQDFADWCYNQPHHNYGYELDKDLLIPGNKIYSPDFCSFIPQELNLLLVDRSRARGEYPQGVSFDKNRDKYRAAISVDGKTVNLGRFNCPNEAHKVYKRVKERHVKNKALEWANRIEWGVFLALMNWTLKS